MKLRNRNITAILRMYVLLFKNYFSSAMNITVGIILTSIILVTWLFFKTSEYAVIDPYILASCLAINVLRNSQHILSVTITGWKTKKLFHNLSNAPISRGVIFFSILSFNYVLTFLISLQLFGLGMLFSSQREILSGVNWGYFILGYVMLTIMATTLCMAIIFTCSAELSNTINCASYFICMYLLGLGIPWNQIAQIHFLNFILYLIPHRYFINIMQAAWINDTKFTNFQGDGIIFKSISYNGNIIIPIVVGIIFIVIFAIYSIIKIRIFTQLSHTVVSNNYQLTMRNNIYMIKNAQSYGELKKIVDNLKLLNNENDNNYQLIEKHKKFRNKREKHERKLRK
ncbi:hypothetical protein [Spiroplasma endosymbiont of Labia minor]|uniref:hypothetical protein n=1 Tax=Spiroplasma endosymbiont of Labia minor TaxID=3066305 RepID=UPI0030CFCAD0